MFGRMRIAMSCAVMTLAMTASLKPAVAGDAPEQGKSAAYTATVRVLKDDAPDNVKAYFAAEHEAAKQQIREYMKYREISLLSLQRLEAAKVVSDGTDLSQIADENVVYSERSRRKSMRIIGASLDFEEAHIEELENPNCLKDIPLLKIDTTELKYGQIGIVHEFQQSERNADGDIMGVISMSEQELNNLREDLPEGAKPPKLPVVIRGVITQRNQSLEAAIHGAVFQVTRNVYKEGKKYPVLEPFDLNPYLKEIPIEEYEKLNGTRIQWPKGVPEMTPTTKYRRKRSTSQPVAGDGPQPTTGAAVQPATQPAGGPVTGGV